MRNVKEDIEMSDEKSSAKGVSPRLIPWQSSLFVPLLALTLGVCGCKSSAFAPRTGEYFQATRMGPGVGCYAYALPAMVGGGCIEKAALCSFLASRSSLPAFQSLERDSSLMSAWFRL